MGGHGPGWPLTPASWDGSDRIDGTWNVVEAEAPTRLVVEDAIVGDDGVPTDGGPTRMEVDIQTAGNETHMTLTTHFDSLEGMERTLASGFDEGMMVVMSQRDALRADIAALLRPT